MARALNPDIDNAPRPAQQAEAGTQGSSEPEVRKIGFGDLQDAVIEGIEDFKAVPTHAFFIGIIYPVICLILWRLLAGYDLLPLVFPIFAGFALIGPLTAIGLYELSRRREQGLAPTAWHAFDVFRSPSAGAIVALSIMMIAIFVAWLWVAQSIYSETVGGPTLGSVEEFVRRVFEKPALIVLGNGVGLLFALLAMTVSVISFPMLADRQVSVLTAVGTSVRVVLQNPLTMAVWGLFVALALLAGAIPFFLGLAVVLPILGHATWHLYRKAVCAGEMPQNDTFPKRA